ncbi:hypothetical protein CYQ88_03750 [Hydrogenovibrio sp. SC-1]|uniref:lipoprotein N-acyltransferase Lnb domain-containing protein n=1 Tax=Hydrogenovibrio sp. SC-1 TaxID=2065820 RepID=UPI000C7A3F26|nr:DUF4105 domain-containing protein [Hydrogenovibrio sp. SC-1]PLA75023.1 hypothetical protein CYQ88_03750 [Hydrogenovibrio sp. SC-1]
MSQIHTSLSYSLNNNTMVKTERILPISFIKIALLSAIFIFARPSLVYGKEPIVSDTESKINSYSVLNYYDLKREAQNKEYGYKTDQILAEIGCSKRQTHQKFFYENIVNTSKPVQVINVISSQKKHCSEQVSKFLVERKKINNFEKFKQQLNLEDIYITIVSPSLTSPMSYFGHSFLIFKKKESWDFSNVLSFSAIIPAKDSYKKILIDGALGNMDGKFIFNQFFEIKRLYTLKEQRGMEIYKLKLTETEKNNLLREIYNKYEKVSRYSFFSQNCSSEIIDYISTINSDVKKQLNSQFLKTPSDTLNILKKVGLISNKHLRIESSLNIELNRYSQFSLVEKDKFKKYFSSKGNLNSISNNEANGVSNTANIFFNFFNEPFKNHNKLVGLNFLNDNPKIDFPFRLIDNYPIKLGIGSVYQNNSNPVKIQILPGYIERSVSKFSRLNETSLKFFNTELQANTNSLKIEKFDFIEMESINKSFGLIDLPSWRGYIGWNNKYRKNKKKVNNVEVGYGFSYGDNDVLISFLPQLYSEFNGNRTSLQGNVLVSYWLNRINFSFNGVYNLDKNRFQNSEILEMNVNLNSKWGFNVLNEFSQHRYSISVYKRFSI